MAERERGNRGGVERLLGVVRCEPRGRQEPVPVTKRKPQGVADPVHDVRPGAGATRSSTNERCRCDISARVASSSWLIRAWVRHSRRRRPKSLRAAGWVTQRSIVVVAIT